MKKPHSILMGALALALPLGLVAVTQTAAVAKTKPPPDPARNCTLSGTVIFAPPGLSAQGTTTSNSALKKTATTTSGTNFGGGCTGSIPPVRIVSKSTKCKGPNNPPNTGCQAKKTWWYDGESSFASSSTLTTITKSIKKITFTLDGVTYMTKTTGAAELVCTNGDVGFKISGTVKKPKNDKGQSSVVDVCLGSDTGPGTTGSFFNDLLSGTGTIATAQIDPSVGGSIATIS
jgi:hypothetical protein